MRLPAMIALLCLAFPAAASPSELLAPSQVVEYVLELVEEVREYTRESPDAPGAFPAWAVDGLVIGEPLLIHRYPALEPSFFIVPVVDDEGRATSFATIDARTGAWHAYWEAGAVVEFPTVSRVRAADIASRELGRECRPEELRAVSMPNKELYWHLPARGDRPEVFISVGDATDVRVGVDAEIAPPALERELSPAPKHEGEGRARPLGRYPPSYDIDGVPFHYQQTNYNCGPAALEMVFDYCGPDINQTDIAHAANTNSSTGTHARDLRRAAHFSYISTSVQWPYIQGYAERPIGYAAVGNQWGSTGGPDYPDRYNDLKNLISTDRPILVLTYYDENHGVEGPNHFRVVKGYDDSTNVFIVHDPWDPSLGPGAYWGPNVHFNQVFFVDDLWRTYDRWGLFAAPWEFDFTLPSTVVRGEEFTLDVLVTYPGPHPFEGDYAAAGPTATIALPPGFSLPWFEVATKALPGIGATGTSDTVSWQVYAGCEPGLWSITVEATGQVSGGCPSYPSYADVIGGEGVAEAEVLPVNRVIYVDVNGGGDYLQIQDGIDHTRCDGDTVIVLPGTYTGLMNKRLDLRGRNIIVKGQGGPENVIIDCQGEHRGLYIHEGEDTTAVVSGFTIRNGYIEVSVGAGALLDASPTLRDLVIEQCAARLGGGIALFECAPVIEDVVVRHCNADSGGGAFCWGGSPARFRNVEFVENEADLRGGGMYSMYSQDRLRNVTFEANYADSGAGAYIRDGSPRLEQVLFSRNTGVRGAALFVEGACGPEITRTTIAYNDAGPGGSAVECYDSWPEISQTIISHTVGGAGILCTGNSVPCVWHCCLYANAGGDTVCGSCETVRSDNVFYDPLYCDAAADDFTLYEDSRCLPPQNPWGETIGRYGAGECGQSGLDEPPEPAKVLTLYSPAPNPAGGTAEVRFEAPEREGNLRVAVYNLRGQLVRVLHDGPSTAGPGCLVWSGTDEAGHPVASGVYFVRAECGADQAIQKVALLR